MSVVASWLGYAGWTLFIIVLIGINTGLYIMAVIAWDTRVRARPPFLWAILAALGLLMTAALVGWGIQADSNAPPCARWGPTVLIPAGKVMVPHRACEQYYEPVEGQE